MEALVYRDGWGFIHVVIPYIHDDVDLVFFFPQIKEEKKIRLRDESPGMGGIETGHAFYSIAGAPEETVAAFIPHRAGHYKILGRNHSVTFVEDMTQDPIDTRICNIRMNKWNELLIFTESDLTSDEQLIMGFCFTGVDNVDDINLIAPAEMNERAKRYEVHIANSSADRPSSRAALVLDFMTDRTIIDPFTQTMIVRPRLE